MLSSPLECDFRFIGIRGREEIPAFVRASFDKKVMSSTGAARDMRNINYGIRTA